MRTDTVALSKLVLAPTNTRRTQPDMGLDELVASIKAHGLLHPLAVKPRPKGKFEVVAGGRRLRALKRLGADGHLDRDHKVEVRVLDDADNPTEISLAENAVRVDMHPADQFEAFKTLADEGVAVDAIADRFGVSARTVQRRLRLGAVSPRLMADYRAGEVSLDQLMALAVSDDHQRQEKAWYEAPPQFRQPRELRRRVTEGRITATDKLAIFVGLEAYDAAGGPLTRDLFGDDVFLDDPALLSRLAGEALATAADAVRAEGWRWVEVHPNLADAAMHTLGRVHPRSVDLSPEDEARLTTLGERFDALAAEAESVVDDAEAARLTDERQAIESEMDAIEARRSRYDATDLACAGAVVSITQHGSLRVERGLVRPEDAKARKKAEAAARRHQAQGGAADAIQAPADQPAPPMAPPDASHPAGPVYSAAVIEHLTAERSAALRAELAGRPDLALVLVVHDLVQAVFHPAWDAIAATDLTWRPQALATWLAEDADPPAVGALAARVATWRGRLPEAADALWDWLIVQDQAVLLDLLALGTAHAVTAVRPRHERGPTRRETMGDKLAQALALDMRVWWQPSEAFLARLTKATLLAAITEAATAEEAHSLADAGKSELVTVANRKLAGARWLPPLLRTASSPPESTATGDEGHPPILPGALAAE